jgi:hypothetical protein
MKRHRGSPAVTPHVIACAAQTRRVSRLTSTSAWLALQCTPELFLVNNNTTSFLSSFYSAPKILRQQQIIHNIAHSTEFIDASPIISDTTTTAATNGSLSNVESEGWSEGPYLSLRLIFAVYCFLGVPQDSGISHLRHNASGETLEAILAS